MHAYYLHIPSSNICVLYNRQICNTNIIAIKKINIGNLCFKPVWFLCSVIKFKIHQRLEVI